MKKILLVNNQEAFLDRNKTLLNRAGFHILTATSTGQALRICREQPVDLIIAQRDHPDGGGDLLCSQIRQDPVLRNVSIILVCYESEVEAVSNCGANAVVTKPVRPEVLLQLVGRFLGIRARRDFRASFEARLHGTREAVPFSGMTRNISASGMLCETPARLNPDDLLIDLYFALDSGEIVTNGKVIWSGMGLDDQQRYGVQFLDLAPELRDKIERFVLAQGNVALC